MSDETNKPSWDTAPTWANWLVWMPVPGCYRWFEHRPIEHEDGWGNDFSKHSHRTQFAGESHLPRDTNWREMIWRRPAK